MISQNHQDTRSIFAEIMETENDNIIINNDDVQVKISSTQLKQGKIVARYTLHFKDYPNQGFIFQVDCIKTQCQFLECSDISNAQEIQLKGIKYLDGEEIFSILEQEELNPRKEPQKRKMYELCKNQLERIIIDASLRYIHLNNFQQISEVNSYKPNGQCKQMFKDFISHPYYSTSNEQCKENYQFLYIMETSLLFKSRVVIKIGKTNQRIDEYKNYLFSHYQKKIIFTPIVYFLIPCDQQERTTVDQYIHNKLSTNKSEYKIYLQGKHIHVEFYFLDVNLINAIKEVMFSPQYMKPYQKMSEVKNSKYKNSCKKLQESKISTQSSQGQLSQTLIEYYNQLRDPDCSIQSQIIQNPSIVSNSSQDGSFYINLKTEIEPRVHNTRSQARQYQKQEQDQQINQYQLQQQQQDNNNNIFNQFQDSNSQFYQQQQLQLYQQQQQQQYQQQLQQQQQLQKLQYQQYQSLNQHGNHMQNQFISYNQEIQSQLNTGNTLQRFYSQQEQQNISNQNQYYPFNQMQQNVNLSLQAQPDLSSQENLKQRYEEHLENVRNMRTPYSQHNQLNTNAQKHQEYFEQREEAKEEKINILKKSNPQNQYPSLSQEYQIPNSVQQTQRSQIIQIKNYEQGISNSEKIPQQDQIQFQKIEKHKDYEQILQEIKVVEDKQSRQLSANNSNEKQEEILTRYKSKEEYLPALSTLLFHQNSSTLDTYKSKEPPSAPEPPDQTQLNSSNQQDIESKEKDLNDLLQTSEELMLLQEKLSSLLIDVQKTFKSIIDI